MTSKTTSKDVDTQSTPQQRSSTTPLDLTRMFALIIGISKYPNTGSLRNLPGVDTDISSMKDFLAMSRVSKILQNEKATASGISDALRAIINDKNIGREDPILIYFAGHGVKVNLTSEDKAMSTTRMLCPYDFVQQTRSAPSSNGISDAALSNFLADISSQKGNNITVILDCCYSGHAIQGAAEVGHKRNPSAVAQRRSSKRTLDDELESIFEHLGVSSHVLLAGCGMEEVGLEKPEGGAYTNALIKILRSSQASMLTYRELIESLDSVLLNNQNPQCIGINQNRRIFSMKTSRHKHYFYKATNKGKSGNGQDTVYKLNAGKASGITKQSTFDIHGTKDRSSPALGKFIVQTLNNYTTFLLLQGVSGNKNNFPSEAYAFSTCTNRAFKLFIPKELSYILKKINTLGKRNNIPIAIISSPADKCNLSLKLGKKKEVEVKPHHSEFTKEISSHTVQYEERKPLASRSPLRTVLDGAADFYSYLNLTPDDHNLFGGSTKNVRLHCYELKEYDEGRYTMEKKDGAKDLIKGGQLHLDRDEIGPLGFEIVNNTRESLYVALFYFDLGDLSITSYYEPGTAKNGAADISIPKEGRLTIGYGSSGWRPRAFSLRDDHDVAVGVLKLFVSTEWVDFSDIAQTSPFEGYKRTGNHDQIYPRENSPWDSLCVSVVQKGAKTSGNDGHRNETGAPQTKRTKTEKDPVTSPARPKK
ncbi:uncharacterized protein STEHIDRAFT_163276 [Stereum hirsutum FP-91666 SS1]|uniref:Peptidase C14 caspase domain-containing protein n=1 Tax=Stereum hirsutum (strain FP-91666) TaxID=721885 RepID=R7RXB1_STEHR|nr:uncharacterized protein STEHIDRAFT_163276 [Stereum hirsutum FP-91666 SS1]EIM80026.1 hypothetical protein STEHIDRAFT_163276 [Stereum hirsutum FP-91666 SS1]